MKEVEDATLLGTTTAGYATRAFIVDAQDVVGEVFAEYAAWYINVPFQPLDRGQCRAFSPSSSTK
eukprot:337261-Heterocapsa_arctica.AAC.1